MSLGKAVSDSLEDRECKKTTLRKRTPVPYVPEKDIIQETVSAMNNNGSLKTTIGEGTKLRLSIWHSTGMGKVLLTHKGLTLDAIKK
jgi:hypothetical protein